MYIGAKKIALGGISSALVVLCLYLGSVVPNNRIFFMAAATYVSSIPYISGGIMPGLISYGASVTLSLLFIPNKAYALGFLILGIYALVKLLCEKYSLLIEFIFKYLWFNVTLVLIYYFFRSFIYIDTNIFKGIGLVILFVISEVLFLLYDYLFTRFIVFIQDKVVRRI
jgi:hypothetical protein